MTVIKYVPSVDNLSIVFADSSCTSKIARLKRTRISKASSLTRGNISLPVAKDHWCKLAMKKMDQHMGKEKRAGYAK